MIARNLLRQITSSYQIKETIALVSCLGKGNDLRRSIVRVGGEVVGDLKLSNEVRQQIVDKVLTLMAKSEPGAVLELKIADDLIKVIIDIIRLPHSLVVFGAGHVGNAVAVIGAFVGFEVTIVDDREGFLTKDRFRDKRIRPLLADFSLAVKMIELSNRTAVVIVTRGHQFDEVCLRGVLGHEIKYLGMIGSRRRVISIMRRLSEEGISQERLASVHAPIGLKIGARSPEEIAISIIAEIIQRFNTEPA